MAGELIQAVKETVQSDESILDALNEDKSTIQQLKDGELAKEQRQQIQQRMKENAGGCCNAATAAEAVRNERTEYR